MRLVAVLTMLLAAPLAAAQAHEHHGENGLSFVLFDGPPDGLAFVNAYTHFGFALLDAEGAPTPHQNAEFNVVQNGEVLLSTTDTHEYDGLFSLDLRFTRPGPYQITAHSGEMDLGVFEGTVVLPDARTNATVVFEAVPQGPASRVLDFTVSVVDEAGALIPHSDVIVEFRGAGFGGLYSRSHLHIHDAPIAFSQGFGSSTQYTAQVIAYVAFGEATDPYVPAVVAEFPVDVGLVSVPAPPTPDLAPPAPLEQVGAVASGGGYTLHAMYDPNNQVGLYQKARLAALIVEDATLLPAAHVDFSFTLNGPNGLVFSSESLHEYDGMFEYVFEPQLPGSYDGLLTAHEGDGLTVPFHLLVLPPAVPLLGGTGPIELGVDGLDDVVANKPHNLTFSAMGRTGPAMHSEVDVTVFHDGEPPLYQFKLHTHESGLTNAMLLFPHEGDWKIRVDSMPTVPEPSTYPSTLFEFAVAPGLAIDGVAAGGVAGAVKDNAVPGAWVLLTLAAVAVVTFARRR